MYHISILWDLVLHIPPKREKENHRLKSKLVGDMLPFHGLWVYLPTFGGIDSMDFSGSCKGW